MAQLDSLDAFGCASDSEALGTAGQPVCEDWCERAARLVVQLPRFERRLQELRSVLPSEATLVAARNAYPRAEELHIKKQELLWRDRMLNPHLWPSKAEVEAQLAQQPVFKDPREWHEAIFRMVRPDEWRVYGMEQAAVRMAEQLVQSVAGTKDSPGCRDTLAFARWRVGDFDGAVSEQERAVKEGGPSGPSFLRDNLDILKAERDAWLSGREAKIRDALAKEIEAMEWEIFDRAILYEARGGPVWIGFYAEVVDRLAKLAQRLNMARRAQADPRWPAAIAAIAQHPSYGGLRMTPQLDLVPIGPDRDSGLWEFAHLPTGTEPVRGDDQKLRLQGESGLVFVLLPAGTIPVVKGKQPDQRHSQRLGVFLLSKYEVTHWQWHQLGGTWIGPTWLCQSKRLSAMYLVRGPEAQSVLIRSAGWLRLPTTVEWEYGCRANARTRWWTGDTVESLVGAANFEGVTEGDNLMVVGRLRANAFGLHDVLGNAAEWCQKRMTLQAGAAAPDLFVVAGGSYGAHPQATGVDLLSDTDILQAPVDLAQEPNGGIRPVRVLHR